MSKTAAIADRADTLETLLVNDVVARRLEKVARLLEAQRDDAFRVRAFGRLPSSSARPVRASHPCEEGIAGLNASPTSVP